MPSPVKGSKKSAASPTRAAPAAVTRPDHAANGPVVRIGRTIIARPTRADTRGGPAGDRPRPPGKELSASPTGLDGLSSGDNQCDIGVLGTDRVDPDIS